MKIELSRKKAKPNRILKQLIAAIIAHYYRKVGER